jgi:hypothetical protein
VADLDEISVMIGEIRADMRHALKWFDEHEKRDQDRYELLVDRIDNSSGFGARITKCEDDLIIAMPIVQGVKRVKWVIAGFVAAIGLVGGAVGSVASAALKWFV